MSSPQRIDLTGLHQTAVASAALRGGHALCGDETKIFRDDLALRLAGVEEADAIAMIRRVSPASASSCILRSRFTEDRLAAARERLKQYVILGAGLDSFALRQADALGDLQVYEVEDPPFQQWKRQRIQELEMKEPDQLHFVPCDFEITSLDEALSASSFDPSQPCFVSWLGVTQYLTLDAIKGTLGWAGSRPAGSEIVLTFLEDNEQAKGILAGVMSGLEQLTCFLPADMTELLAAAGFSRIDYMDPERANEIYFRDRKDGLIAPQVQRLVSAIV